MIGLMQSMSIRFVSWYSLPSVSFVSVDELSPSEFLIDFGPIEEEKNNQGIDKDQNFHV